MKLYLIIRGIIMGLAVAILAAISAQADQATNALCVAGTAAPGDMCKTVNDVAVLPIAVRKSHVFFPHGGTILDSTAKRQLVAIGTLFQAPVMDGTCLRLIGHADPSGPADINKQMSLLRAQTVANFLAKQLPNHSHHITVLARGEENLLQDIPKDSVAHRRVAIEARTCPDL